ncbi:MAG: inosine/xanthosine triphosphatase [Nanoarchaeota archaeon]
MDISCGSTGQNKVEGVRRGLTRLPYFAGAIVYPIDVKSGVRDQPMGIDEIELGATNRAINAFNQYPSRFGIGIESGIVPPNDKRTFALNHTICRIYDGKRLYPGAGMAFPIQNEVLKIIVSENVELDEALRRAGLTNEERIGKKRGIISMLTNGEVERTKLIEDAVYAAALAIVNNY